MTGLEYPQSETTSTTTWTAQVSGLRGLPLRIAFNSADFGRLLWWLAFAVIPGSLLAIAVSGSEFATYAYTMYSAVVMMAILQTSERFIKMTVELDQAAGDLVGTYHMGEPTLFRSDQEATLSFEDVETAQFVSLAGQTMVRLYHKRPFSEGTAFLVPPDVTREFCASLQRHNVQIRGAQEANTNYWVWGRFVVTILLQGLIPISAVFIWPADSWAIILVLVVNSIFLVRQGW